MKVSSGWCVRSPFLDLRAVLTLVNNVLVWYWYGPVAPINPKKYALPYGAFLGIFNVVLRAT